MVVAFGIAFTIVGWIALMVSFWLPEPAAQALQATAWAMGIPGLAVAAIGLVCEEELVAEFDRRRDRVQRTRALRCTDCGNKILNVGGTTVGDQLESELMNTPWKE
jgi:DNA-directed RNA polymerase subunit RPC12/RpoP